MGDFSRHGARGGPRNVRMADRRSDNHIQSPSSDSVYADRRGDTPLRREYDFSFDPSPLLRDDLQESRGPENHRDDRFNEATTPSASLHQPTTISPITRPHVSRYGSFRGITDNGTTESPARSPASASSSIRSDPRLHRDDADFHPERSATGESSGPKVTDPRLRMVRKSSEPVTRAPSTSLTEKKETGPSAAPHASLDNSSGESPTISASRAVSLPSGDQSVTNIVVDALLHFMDPAVTAGIHQQEIERLEEQLKKAKDGRDKAFKQPKLPSVMIEAHRTTYELAAEKYSNVSKELAGAQARRTALAAEFFTTLGAYIRDTSAQQIQKLKSEDANDQLLWQQNTTATIESVEKQLESIQASNNASDAITLLEGNQRSLQQIIQEAQPRFEKTIDSLNKKSKDQQAEITTLRAENMTLKTEMTETRQQIQRLDETFTHRLDLAFPRSEFDAYKAHVTSLQASREDATIEQAKLKVEVQALSAQTASLRQIFESMAGQDILKPGYHVSNQDSNQLLPSPQVQPRDDSGGQLSDVQSQLNLIKSEMKNFSSRISKLSCAEQIVRDAIQLCKDVKSQLQALQIDLEVVQQSKQTGDQPTHQHLKHHSWSTTDDVQKIEEKVSDVARQTTALQSEVEVLRRATSLSTAAGSGEGSNTAKSLTIADKFERLSDHMAELKSEIKRTDELRHGNAISIKALEAKVEQSQGSASTERKFTEISGKLEDLSNRPTTLSTKERMLLNTLDSTTKRVNDLESTVFDLVKDDSHNISTAKSQDSGLSATWLNEVKERIDGLQANCDRLHHEAEEKASGREAELSRLKKYCEDSISAVARSIDQTKTGLKANEHSLQSLTSRYNNLTSEKIVRQVADITQPAVRQIQREQTDMKTQYKAIETNLAELMKSFEGMKQRVSDHQSSAEILSTVMETIRKGFVEEEEFHNLQETLLTFTNRISKLEDRPVSVTLEKSVTSGEDGAVTVTNEPPLAETLEGVSSRIVDLSTQLVQGRDALQAGQKAHETHLNGLDYRLKKLEGRVANVNDWAPDDEDEDSSQKDSSDLLRHFDPSYGSAHTTTGRAASRQSATSTPARFSPASTMALEKVGGTTRVSPSSPKITPTEPDIASSGLQMPSTWLRSEIDTARPHPRVGPVLKAVPPKNRHPLSPTSRTEPLRSLASRIEAPKPSSQGLLGKKRLHRLSDSDDDFIDDILNGISQSSGGSRSAKKKNKKGKKTARFQ